MDVPERDIDGYYRLGEWESITALLADRDEATTYLKVEALQAQLEAVGGDERLRAAFLAGYRCGWDAGGSHGGEPVQGGDDAYAEWRAERTADAPRS